MLIRPAEKASHHIAHQAIKLSGEMFRHKSCMSHEFLLSAIVHHVATVQEAIPVSAWLNTHIREEYAPCVKERAVIVTLSCRTADGARVKLWTEDSTHDDW